MPTYEYECRKCGHRLEEFQYFSEKPLRKCPSCGKLSLRRLIGTGSAVIFKGSGFYETDYRRRRNDAKDSKAGDKPAASSGEGSSSGGAVAGKPGGESGSSKASAS